MHRILIKLAALAALGATLPALAADETGATYGSGNRRMDATQALRAQVRGGRLDAEVSNGLAGGDPAPNQRKQLVVTYRLDNGPSMTQRVMEGDRIRLP